MSRCELCGRSSSPEPIMDGQQRTIVWSSVLALAGVVALGFFGRECQQRRDIVEGETARIHVQAESQSFQVCVQNGNDPAVCRGEKMETVRCIGGPPPKPAPVVVSPKATDAPPQGETKP